MRFSAKKQTCAVIALLAIFFLVSGRNLAVASSSYTPCKVEDDYFVIAPPRDCRDKSDAGTFKFNTEALSSCYISHGSGAISKVFGSAPDKMDVALSVPLENFTSLPVPVNGNVVIEMTAPRKNLGQYDCGSQRLNALVAYDVSVAEKEKIYPVSVSNDVFSLTGLPRKAVPHSMIESGEWSVQPNSRNAAAQGRYDIYYQKKDKHDIRYRVVCFDWNNECHGEVGGILDGRYNYRVMFSKQHIEYLVDIIAGADALLSIAYEDN